MVILEIKKLTVYEYDEHPSLYMYPGGSWTYEVSIDTIQEENLFISIGYYNTVIKNTIDFLGPTRVTIPAGEYSTTFNINLFVTDNIFEKHFNVTAFIDDESTAEVNSFIVQRTACPWYVPPKAKRKCDPMIGLPPEYQEEYCNSEDDYFRDTGPACKDIYFWDMIACSDAFVGYPARYPPEE